MSGEKNLHALLKTMTPELNAGEFVFITAADITGIDNAEIICTFREKEGITVITSRQVADRLNIPYSFVASWITLTVHSSLEAVGLTAAFSSALTNAGISCNVIAGYYHDHIFVPVNDTAKAMETLRKFSVSF